MRRLLLPILLASCFLFQAHAFDVEVDGIYYGLFGKKWAYVTHCGEWTMEEVQGAAYSGEVVIPEQISYNGYIYPVLSVGENAFAGCEELTSVCLPSSVRAVSGCAFLGCTNLRRVSLPANIRAFGSCSFTGCTSLEQISLPRQTEIIDTLTLYCCASLSSLALPHRIKKVCQGALEHLPAMTDLYCFASTPPDAEQGAFTLADQQRCTLHVPAAAVHLYQASPLWSNFYQIVALDDDDYLGYGYRRGDINADGKVDAEDLALLQRLIVRKPTDAHVLWAADINGDDVVNAQDYVLLAKEL